MSVQVSQLNGRMGIVKAHCIDHVIDIPDGADGLPSAATTIRQRHVAVDDSDMHGV